MTATSDLVDHRKASKARSRGPAPNVRSACHHQARMRAAAAAILALVLASDVIAETAVSAEGSQPAFSSVVMGTGRPILLIPGLSCSGAVWNATVERLKESNECHVLTLAGFAGQPPIGEPYLASVRDAVLRYIDERGLQKPVIVGHSLGGFLAFSLASTAPEKIGPVIAVDGVPFLPALMGGPKVTVEASKGYAEWMRKTMSTQTAEQFQVQNKAFLKSMVKSPDDLEFVTKDSTKSDPPTVALAMYEMMVTDLRPDVAKIQSPVLLIAAGEVSMDGGRTQSPDFKKSLLAAYADQIASIPKHELVVAENARHFIMLDQPEFFYTTVEKFLAENPASP